MSLIRFMGRSLFAGVFIADGLKKVTKPAEQADEAEAFTNKVTPLLQRVAPAGYSSHIPEKPETWVRVMGAAQVAGGVMYATGLFRRLGAFLLTNAGIMNVAIAWPDKNVPAKERSEARSRALTQAALLGAALVATQDLQGKPSFRWRTEHAAGQAAHKADKTRAKLTRKARKTAKKANKHAKKIGQRIESVVN